MSKKLIAVFDQGIDKQKELFVDIAKTHPEFVNQLSQAT